MSKTKKPKIKQWQWFGLLWLLVGFLWCWLFFIDDARLSNSKIVSLLTTTVVFFLIVSISTVIFWRTIHYLSRSVKKSKQPWLSILKIFFVWAFAEFLVSWLVAVIWMGHNGSWSSVLPFSSLAPWLAWTPLRFLSRLVGFYGLSASIVTLIFILCDKKLRRYAAVYTVSIIILTLAAWAIWAKPNQPPTAATIVAEQLGQPQSLKINNSTLVVLPEYGLDNYNGQTVNQRLSSSQKIYFVGSQQIPNGNGLSNLLIFGSNQDGFLQKEQKSRLIPGGEYLPFGLEVILKNFAKNTYDNFIVSRAVVKGSGKMPPFKLNSNVIIGAAACSGIISTEDYRDQVAQGATVLTNSASLEIFRGSKLFNWEHRGLAKFMAVANARPFLQSSNNWPAFALDQNGNQIAEIQPVSHALVRISPNSRKTVYSLFADWPVVVGGTIVAAEVFSKFRKS